MRVVVAHLWLQVRKVHVRQLLLPEKYLPLYLLRSTSGDDSNSSSPVFPP